MGVTDREECAHTGGNSTSKISTELHFHSDSLQGQRS